MSNLTDNSSTPSSGTDSLLTLLGLSSLLSTVQICVVGDFFKMLLSSLEALVQYSTLLARSQDQYYPTV